MVWKFWFVLSSVLYTLGSLMGPAYPELAANLNNTTFTIGILDSIVWIICIGYFYALGWNKKMYSEKFHKSFIILFVLSIIIFVIGSAYGAYSSVQTNQQLSTIAALAATMVGTVFVVVLSAIILSPAYIALVKYKKRLEQLDVTDNSFWKLLALAVLLSFVGSFLPILTININNLLTSYNAWDIYAILTCIYESILLMGFAFKKKFFSQLFWKISGIVYAISLIPTNLFVSQKFKTDILMLDNLWSYNVYILLMTMLFLYVLYKYSFTNAVFKKENEILTE